jgi:hypothetical protein
MRKSGKFVFSSRYSGQRKARAEPPRRNRVLRGILRFDRAFYGIRNAVERSSFVHVAAICLAFFTFVQLSIDLWDRVDERSDREEARVERAWAHLLVRVGGETGKGSSLALLLKTAPAVAGLDLSCKSLGDWDSTTGTCLRAPIFTGFDLNSAKPYFLGNVRPRDWITPEFSGSVINNARMNFAQIREEKFRDTVITMSDLSMADFAFRITRIEIEKSDVSFASLGFPILKKIASSNVSGIRVWFWETNNRDSPSVPPGARFRGSLEGNWFWADKPPLVLRQFYGKVPDPNYQGPSSFSTPELLSFLRASRAMICDPTFRAERPPKIILDLKYYWEGRLDHTTEIEPALTPDAHARRKAVYGGPPCDTISLDQAFALFPEKYVVPRWPF